MACHVKFVRSMTDLTLDQLGTVGGGAPRAFGRCGPSDKMQWLFGNHFTPACEEHDRQVQQAMDSGSSYLGAQVKALPALRPAFDSWVEARFGGSGSGTSGTAVAAVH